MALMYGGRSKHLLLGRNFFLITSIIWVTFVFIIFLVSKYLFDNNQSLARLVILILCFGPIYLILQFLIKNNIVDLKKYLSGIVGEDLILSELVKLSDNYSVFHGLKLPGQLSDIDFAVVGPTGVFIGEVKNHKGIVGFDGQELTLNKKRILYKDLLKQTKNEALDLNNFLLATTNENIFVTPILVFSNPSTKFNLRSNFVNKVHVISSKNLIDTLLNRPATQISDKILNVLKSLFERP